MPRLPSTQMRPAQGDRTVTTQEYLQVVTAYCVSSTLE